MQTRKRKPIKPATAAGFESYLNKWLRPNLGDMPLSSVNNLAVRGLVTKMTDAGMSPKMVNNVIQVVKMVVASAVNENGERVHPRTWNHEFIDLPEVKNQRQPTFTSDGDGTRLQPAPKEESKCSMSFSEPQGCESGRRSDLKLTNISPDDFSTLHIRQKVWNGHIQPFLKSENGIRDIDLPTSIVAAMLKEFVGDRTSGLLFCSKNGTSTITIEPLETLPASTSQKAEPTKDRVLTHLGGSERHG